MDQNEIEIEQRSFYYIDAMPGAGKTEFFVSRAVQLLNSRSPRWILVYVAPTVRLLQEAYNRIARYPGLQDLGSMRHVQVVASSSRIHASDFETPYFRPIMDPPARALNFLFGLMSRTDYLETDVPKSLKHEARPGTIIMTTHEAFVRVSRTDDTGRNFQTMKQMEVVFDEARKCVMMAQTLNLSTEYLKPFFKSLDPEPVVSKEVKGRIQAATNATPWNLLKVKGMEDVQGLKRIFQVGRLDAIPKVVLQVRAKYNQYVKSGRGTLYLLSTATFGESIGVKRGDQAVFYMILRPTTLFTNYRRVILTSAFFKDSQMYHFLRADDHKFVDLLKAQPDNPSLRAIAERDIRLRAAAGRRLVVAPLLKKPQLSNSPKKLGIFRQNLTRTLLDRGMVVSTDLQRRSAGRVLDMPLQSVLESLTNGTSRVTPDQKLQRELEHYAVPPLWVLLEKAAQIFHRWVAQSPHMKAQTQPLILLTMNALSNSSRTWGPSGVRYLHVLNNLMRYGRLKRKGQASTGSDLLEGSEALDVRATPDVWAFWLAHHIFAYSKTACFTVPSSPHLHGINRYSKMNAFAHLAALNPDRQLIEVYKGLIPRYNVDLDHSIENLVQTLYRTSLRNPDAKDQVLMIVPYEEAADLLADKIGSKDPFKLFCQPELTVWNHRKTMTEAQEKHRIESVVTARRKYDPKYASQIKRLQSMVSGAKARLKLRPGDQARKTSLKNHERALEQLKKKATL